MLSSKEKLPLLMAGIILLLTIGLLLNSYYRDRSAALMAAAAKAKTDLDTAEAVIDLKYSGPWSIRGEELYKGQLCLNDNFVIVDYIDGLLGDICVIFKNNICVSTTVLIDDCDRATGVYAPYEVTSKVLETGFSYTGEAKLSGRTYRTAYKPINNEFGQIIGVLYIGVPVEFPHTIIDGANKTIGLVGLLLALLVGVLTRFYVARTSIRPLHEGIINDQTPAVKQQPDIDSQDIANEGSRTTDAENERSPEQGEALDWGGEAGSEWFGAWFDRQFDQQQELPKGLNRVTLRQVVLFLKEQEGNRVTIHDISEALSLSNVTVRHYLDYLAESDLVEIEKQYGSVGRPSRYFKLKM